MRSDAVGAFWKLYNELPGHVRELADKQFALFLENPS